MRRARGYGKRCRQWRVPADTALGLEESAGYSPAVQEMAALLASKTPVEEASTVFEHLTGVKTPRATLDREARRQGERAQAVRPRHRFQPDGSSNGMFLSRKINEVPRAPAVNCNVRPMAIWFWIIVRGWCFPGEPSSCRRDHTKRGVGSPIPRSCAWKAIRPKP